MNKNKNCINYCVNYCVKLLRQLLCRSVVLWYSILVYQVYAHAMYAKYANMSSPRSTDV